MGHFSYYERIPQATHFRGQFAKIARRIIRRIWWPEFLAQEVRFQKIYDVMEAVRTEHRRLDAQACMRLAVGRRLDFMDKAIANLQTPSIAERGVCSSAAELPRARCA
ncbi:MAG TPA: hypothetical protein VGP68_19990 [Gemmataceae bacterium]|jgi:hypothetical protein|nr:hypothetical protein [Gemmataceae bacterium]